MKNKKWIKLLLVILACVVFGIVFTCSLNKDIDSDPVLKEQKHTEVTTNNESKTDTDTVNSTTDSMLLCVHVCGEVVKPDVYYLQDGSRVHEAIQMAGGLTADADANYINMAKLITDGQQIYIPSKKETENSVNFSGFNYIEDDGLVDINTADIAELMELPGIGETKANAIIKYREETGGFNSIDEIKNVSGIGDSLFEEIKDKIKI